MLKLFGWFTSNSMKFPECTGPFAVGCVDVMFAATDSLPYGSFLRLFYPTNINLHDTANQTLKQTLWCSRREYSFELAKFINTPSWLVGRVIHWMVGHLHIPALQNAPLFQSDDETNKGLPCIVFSHGLGANRFMYSTYCTELASQGCFVAMLEHRDTSACASYVLKENECGKMVEEWIPYHKKTDSEDEFSLRNGQLCQRREECISAMNVLEHLQNGTVPKNLLSSEKEFDLQQFKGKLDLQRTALLGHSFGGATVVATLAKENRFRCGIALDVWMLPLGKEIHKEEIDQPLLFINTYHFYKWKENFDELEKLIKNKPDKRPVIAVRKTSHMSQCDVPFLFGSYLSWVSGWRSDSLSSTIADSTYKQAMWVFLCRNLGIGNPPDHEPILDGDGGEHVIVGIENKDQSNL